MISIRISEICALQRIIKMAQLIMYTKKQKWIHCENNNKLGGAFNLMNIT